MKKILFTKKLTLKKEVVSKLNSVELLSFTGGKIKFNTIDAPCQPGGTYDLMCTSKDTYEMCLYFIV